jgi:hypothetical protein
MLLKFIQHCNRYTTNVIDHLGDLGVDGITILKLILEKWDVRFCT